MSTTPDKTFPRFEAPLRGRDADAFVRPLPSVLLELVESTPEGERHATLTARYSEAKTRAVALAQKLQTAEREDLERERAALEKGGAVPKPRVPGLTEQLERARRDVGVLGDLLEEASDALLIAAVPHLADAARRADADEEAALDEARDLLVACDAAFERAAELAGASGWVGGLQRDGTVHPFRALRVAPAPRTAGLVRQAIPTLAEERHQRVEALEHGEREWAAAMRDLPPGTEVWDVDHGTTTIVGADDAEQQEDEE